MDGRQVLPECSLSTSEMRRDAYDVNRPSLTRSLVHVSQRRPFQLARIPGEGATWGVIAIVGNGHEKAAAQDIVK